MTEPKKTSPARRTRRPAKPKPPAKQAAGKKSARSKAGRSGVVHKPTEELKASVQAMATVGASQAVIAMILDVDEKTLRKYYPDQLRAGRQRGDLAVMQNLWKFAAGRKGNDASQIAAIKHWTAHQMGWKSVGGDGSGGAHEGGLQPGPDGTFKVDSLHTLSDADLIKIAKGEFRSGS